MIDDEVRRLHDTGLGERRIAQRLGVGRGVIQTALKKLNLSGCGKRPSDQLLSVIPEEKQCSVCSDVKPIDQFRVHKRGDKSGWRDSKCLSCEKIYNQEMNAQPESKATRRKYRIVNRISVNQQDKNKRDNNPAYRIRKIVSASIYRYLKNNGGSKNGKSVSEYLPYTIQELRQHLQSQFESWMTWDNHGKYDSKMWDDDDPDTWMWQIDHIIPQSKLPYASMDDENFKKCWDLSNLRPLNAKQNAVDGGRKVRHNSILV